MLDESCVQVAVYDDRLEVTSPGGLYNGLTYDEMLNGRSVLRNRAIANVFNQMGLIEAWGTGIKRICEEAARYGLRDPEFLEFDDMFRINLYRKNAISQQKTKQNKSDTNTNTKTDTNTDTENKLIALIRNNPSITQDQMAEQAGLSKSGVRYALANLREKGIVTRTGNRKEGRWEIIIGDQK